MISNPATTRRQTLALGAGAALSLLGSPLHGSTRVRPIVIELFTSQGCSSCPPADEFLKELRGIEGIIAISFHVDYWDHLGWRDTLSDRAYSERQYDYASRRGDSNIYTPQAIVNGKSYHVGSNKAAIKAAIRGAQTQPDAMWVPMAIENSGTEIAITVDAHESAPESTIWLIAIAPLISVKIERGENADRDIAYYNVVRKIVPAGKWAGAALKRVFPISAVSTIDTKAFLALLQVGSVGSVIGSASWGKVVA
jgi:hypothetical protein